MTGVIIDHMAVRVSSPVLIGRSGEIGRLRASLQAAHEGRSSATLLAGEAGVGKTRVVAEIAAIAQAEGAIVLLGGCIDLGEGSMPYAPVAEALRGLVRQADPEELDLVLGQGRTELARLVPDLGPVAGAGGSAAGALSYGSGQGRLFELLLGVLERLAARAPVVFIVEDLHWSDRSTRDLLGFLVRNLRDVPVMLLFTYRSDELHRRHPLLPFLAELERTGRVERLALVPFDRRESAQQLRAIAGHDLDAGLIESIHARSPAATRSLARSCSSRPARTVGQSCPPRCATCSWPGRPTEATSSPGTSRGERDVARRDRTGRGCYIICSRPLQSFEILRALYLEFRTECSVLVFAWRANQGQLVTASLHSPSSIHVDPRGITRSLDLPIYLFCCFIYRIRAVVGDNQRIRLARVITLHRSCRRTNDDRSKPAGPSKCNLSLNRATPIVFLFAGLVFIKHRGDNPRANDCFLEALFLSRCMACGQRETKQRPECHFSRKVHVALLP